MFYAFFAVYNDGNICLDILQTQWSPIYDISAILTSIQSLLSDPNPSSPANQEAARLYAENRREYNRRVQQCATESWKTVETQESTQQPLQAAATEPTPSPSPAAAAAAGGGGGEAAAAEGAPGNEAGGAPAGSNEMEGIEEGGGGGGAS
ncbi:hypothetical protein Emed_006485 [Eimeria media]